MDNLEKVEKLREKTGVSYEEAKNALEACGYDVLDAIIYLEKQGKVKSPKVDSFTTESITSPSQEFQQAQQSYNDDCKRNTFGQTLDKFFSWCGRVLKKSIESKFIVERRGDTVMNIPVLLLIIAIIFAFWIAIPLLIVGLFCECKYRFRGIDDINVNLNNVCDKAAQSAENIKADMHNNK